MRALWITVAGSLFIALAPQARSAELTDPVPPGARVRVSIPDASYPGGDGEELVLYGTVARVTTDTLVLTVPPARGELSVLRSTVKKL